MSQVIVGAGPLEGAIRKPSNAFGGGSGASTFLDLTDTPSAYTGHGGKFLRVNATPNAVEFFDLFGTANTWTAGQTLGTTTKLLFRDADKYIASDSSTTLDIHIGPGQLLRLYEDSILFATLNASEALFINGFSLKGTNLNVTSTGGSLNISAVGNINLSGALVSVVTNLRMSSANEAQFRANTQRVYSSSASTLDVDAATTFNMRIGGSTINTVTASGTTLGGTTTVGTLAGLIYGTTGVLSAIANDSDGKVLTMVSGSPAWAAATGGATALDDLTDVVITSPATGAVLQYTGIAWADFDLLAAGNTWGALNTFTSGITLSDNSTVADTKSMYFGSANQRITGTNASSLLEIIANNNISAGEVLLNPRVTLDLRINSVSKATMTATALTMSAAYPIYLGTANQRIVATSPAMDIIADAASSVLTVSSEGTSGVLNLNATSAINHKINTSTISSMSSTGMTFATDKKLILRSAAMYLYSPSSTAVTLANIRTVDDESATLNINCESGPFDLLGGTSTVVVSSTGSAAATLKLSSKVGAAEADVLIGTSSVSVRFGTVATWSMTSTQFACFPTSITTNFVFDAKSDREVRWYTTGSSNPDIVINPRHSSGIEFVFRSSSTTSGTFGYNSSSNCTMTVDNIGAGTMTISLNSETFNVTRSGVTANIGTAGSSTITIGNSSGTIALNAPTTVSSLTSGRVVIAGASGLLTGDSDLTFSTDTLIVTKLQVGGGAVINQIDPEKWTPTITSVANVAATTAHQCKYIRVGNIVVCSGRVDIDPTSASTATSIGISLPIASTFTHDRDCTGTGNSRGHAVSGDIGADTTNHRASLDFVTASEVSNRAWYFNFVYEIK